MCVCVCVCDCAMVYVCVCVRACVRVCVCVSDIILTAGCDTLFYKYMMLSSLLFCTSQLFYIYNYTLVKVTLLLVVLCLLKLFY